MFTRGIALAVSMTLLLEAPKAHAWNEVGHMVVAKLAWDRLDTGSKKEATRLLKRHPHYATFLTTNRPEKENDADEWAFLRAATWPDWVRPPKHGELPRPAQIIRYHRGDDHFVDMPFVLPGSEGAVRVANEPDKNDILGAFRQRIGELTSKQTTESDKAVAICWILHLVGDVHQPLHCCVQYSAPDFKDGDVGGNLFAVQIAGQNEVLHTYWDGLLGTLPGFEDTADHQRTVYQLVLDMVEPLEHNPAFRRDGLALLTEHVVFADWAQESFALAKQVAYRDGDKPLAGKRIENGNMPADPPKAGDQYDPTARAVARQRAVLAGYRLADKLNALLKNQLYSPPDDEGPGQDRK